GRLDGRPNALVGAAAADVSCHASVNVFIAGLRLVLEQGNGLHDLSGLAVAALRDVKLDPFLLHRVQAVFGNRFDRSDLFADGRTHTGHAGTDCLAVLVNGTGAAQSHTAAKLGSGQTQHVAHIPQQRQVGIAVVGSFYAIDFDLH